MKRLLRGVCGLARLMGVNTRVDNTEKNLGKLRARLNKLSARVDRQNARITEQNAQIARIIEVLDTLEQTLDQQNARIANFDGVGRSESLGKRLEQLKVFLPQLRASRAPVGKPEISGKEVLEEISKVEHWYHRIQVAPGIFTPGINDSDAALEAMEVPEWLDGMRVLDIGTRDGYFSFVAESRGAEVLAIDTFDPELSGFSTAAPLMGSSVEYRTMNVYDVSPESVGT